MKKKIVKKTDDTSAQKIKPMKFSVDLDIPEKGWESPDLLARNRLKGIK